MSSSENGSRLGSRTNPPLMKGQIWLPGGNPESEEAREITVLGDEEINFILPNSGKRQTRQTEPIARFVLWILKSKCKEVSVVLSDENATELLVED